MDRLFKKKIIIITTSELRKDKRKTKTEESDTTCSTCSTVRLRVKISQLVISPVHMPTIEELNKKMKEDAERKREHGNEAR